MREECGPSSLDHREMNRGSGELEGRGAGRDRLQRDAKGAINLAMGGTFDCSWSLIIPNSPTLCRRCSNEGWLPCGMADVRVARGLADWASGVPWPCVAIGRLRPHWMYLMQSASKVCVDDKWWCPDWMPETVKGETAVLLHGLQTTCSSAGHDDGGAEVGPRPADGRVGRPRASMLENICAFTHPYPIFPCPTPGAWEMSADVSLDLLHLHIR